MAVQLLDRILRHWLRHREIAYSTARGLLRGVGRDRPAAALTGAAPSVMMMMMSKMRLPFAAAATRGLGTYTGAALGSAAQGVAQRSTVPVRLVK